MRNTKEFSELLKQYLRAPIREKRAIYKKLEKCATKFFDFCMLFQFGEKEDQMKAFKKMAKTYLDERYPTEIHQNIMDLLTAIDEINAIDEDHVRDKEKFLDKFFNVKAKNGRKDDLLFYLAESDDGKHIIQARKKIWKFYKTWQGLQRGIKAKRRRNTKLCQKSTFLGKSLDILGSI